MLPSLPRPTQSGITHCAGQCSNITVTFAPSSAGLKTATVHIANDDCDEADYDFALQGIGICNPPVFSTCPAQQTVTAANGSCTALVTYAATVSGIPTPTLSYAFSGATTASSSGTGSGLPFNIGITNVVITAVNACGSTTCSFTVTVKAPEINVQGNGINIVDGDNTPVSSDHTNIGLVNVGNNAVRTFTVQNTGTSNLSLGSITVTGTDAAMFSVGALSPASPIVPGGAATFTVTFAPTSPGLKNVTLQIANNDCNEANYDFALRGLGFQSPLTLGAYPNTTLIAGTNTKITPSVAPTNAVSIVAYSNTNFTGILTVNPGSGVITITDAKQAGIYAVTVKAFGSGGLTATRTFTLTVTNPNCSQGLFTGTTNVGVGSYLIR
ncbi:MAG: choice-of-anchor D domain-containing protein [Haliscomenobacter sp.]|nr:choice-of-anchor D domain-containing protein [Haliscomenobacter sp.]MBK9488284.1 choice-of-anchor D domain-containing protein [Haliscomenobacter sp.]